MVILRIPYSNDISKKQCSNFQKKKTTERHVNSKRSLIDSSQNKNHRIITYPSVHVYRLRHCLASRTFAQRTKLLF